jgi:hypothetical protein
VHRPRLLNQLPNVHRAFNFSQYWKSAVADQSALLPNGYETTPAPSNPLKAFFDSRKEGRGIWKWSHYFDIYHRHFSKFVGRKVNVLEIGVYSGGSLEMWKEYFGPHCHIYGVDIEESCKCYEDDSTEIFIGDQADRDFWKAFKERVPAIDILIDDGGHQTEQQIVTLEEMLPHLRPGGVYVCEDVHGQHNGFSGYMQGLVSNLNVFTASGPERIVHATEFQSSIRSVHFYPFVTVIEKADRPVKQFLSLKHGTTWQPFL